MDYILNSLTSITIPNKVTSIGEMAFFLCTGLTSITIPDSVTSIGRSAFSGCSGLTNVAIGNSVTSIGYEAFSGCPIEIATIPASACSNMKDKFGDLKTVVITTGTYISDNAFSGCSGLTSINIPDSVTSIGRSAFYGCSGLTSINIPDSVTSIGTWAFSGCSGLTRITVSKGNPVYHSQDNCLIYTPNKVLVLGCKTSIIPTDGSVTSIGDWAFSSCSSLTSITIPDTITRIGVYAFSGCSSLTSIVFNGTKEQWNAIKKYGYWNASTGDYTIHCSDGDIAK